MTVTSPLVLVLVLHLRTASPLTRRRNLPVGIYSLFSARRSSAISFSKSSTEEKERYTLAKRR
ncbi:hypothetical protein GCM10010174_81240 [Kutzneria viridogrisea]